MTPTMEVTIIVSLFTGLRSSDGDIIGMGQVFLLGSLNCTFLFIFSVTHNAQPLQAIAMYYNTK